VAEAEHFAARETDEQRAARYAALDEQRQRHIENRKCREQEAFRAALAQSAEDGRRWLAALLRLRAAGGLPMAAILVEVLLIHQPDEGGCGECGDEDGPGAWPCPTVEAIFRGLP
jgi:hypothetical protein